MISNNALNSHLESFDLAVEALGGSNPEVYAEVRKALLSLASKYDAKWAGGVPKLKAKGSSLNVALGSTYH